MYEQRSAAVDGIRLSGERTGPPGRFGMAVASHVRRKECTFFWLPDRALLQPRGRRRLPQDDLQNRRAS